MRCFIITKKTLVIGACLVLTAVVGLFGLGLSDNSITASEATRKLPIYCTDKEEKIASLSFDAAWGNEDTQELIDILDKYKVKATFFVVGQWVDKYPESVKALFDAGHEIGNHSDTHPNMPTLSREDMAKEISSCNDKIEAITGKRPTLFRAPFGDYDNALLEVLEQQGMHCVQWDVDSLDWKDRTAEQIYQRVVSEVESGSICLFHNAAPNTPAALPHILEDRTTQGYTLKPIGEHIYKKDFTINHEGRQIANTQAKSQLS